MPNWLKITLATSLLLLSFGSVSAEEISDKTEFAVGKILTTDEMQTEIQIFSKSHFRETITTTQDSDFTLTENQKPVVGEKVIIGKFQTSDGDAWQIYDRYRLPALLALTLFAFGLVSLVGGKRGLTALFGLMISIGLIAFGLIPLLAAGYPPLWIGLLGGSVIAGIGIFIAHGFNRRSVLAFYATFLTLIFATLLIYACIIFTELFGTGSEESVYLTGGMLANLDLQGLLFAGILLGSLGVLDDITVAQVTVVDELQTANPKLTKRELFRSSLRVGREHIASMVNTLALAYVGVALPLILLLAVDSSQPLWVVINSEFIGEEIVRTLVGVMALTLASPIASFFGANFLKRK
jgi:uncharacterized membrane protein